MNKIEKLIKELCPNGVEWKKLGEVCKVLRGKRLTKSQLTESGKYKVYHGGIEPIGFYGEMNRNANTVMVINVGASAGSVSFSKEDFWSSDGCYCISQTEYINSRFLYYYFLSIEYVITTKVRHAGIPTLDSKVIEDLLIPLPPLPIQTEIVRILDKFVEQQEQLERLIELRKKQYEYYREELLKPKEGEVEIPFSDCCTLVTKQTGFDYSSKIKPALKKQYEEGCIPFLQTRNFTNNVFDYNTEYYVPEEIVKQFPKIVLDEKCLLFSIVGASIGNVGLFPGDKKCFLGGAICVAKIKKDYDVSYLYYFMASSQGQLQIMQKTKGAGQATITIEDIRNFTVRIPSKEKMSSIVNALVALENSINALTSALEASKRRYEYYRDEMMRF